MGIPSVWDGSLHSTNVTRADVCPTIPPDMTRLTCIFSEDDEVMTLRNIVGGFLMIPNQKLKGID